MRLPDGNSLLAGTLHRAAALAGPRGPILIVTHRDHYFLCKDEVRRVWDGDGADGVNYMLEPEGRNTAAAIAMAAHWVVHAVAADALMLVLPADHRIEPLPAFETAVRAATLKAAQGSLVTFGIRPTRPETGYGYIQMESPSQPLDARAVIRFVEKPDAETAQRFVSDGSFLWNSGMFCMRAEAVLGELQEHQPALAQGAKVCWAEVERVPTAQPFVELPAKAFKALESISIDYALMERTRNLAVLPVEFTWDDIGSWDAVASLVPADAKGNRVHGDAVLMDSEACFVHANERVTALLGLRGVMVIDTPDALLVADASKTQHVRKVVEQLKARGHDTYRAHRTVQRPWGTYTVLEDGRGDKIKRIEVEPGGSLSLQMHRHRSEHWIVVSGTAEVTRGGQTAELHVNESTYIPAGQAHRLANTTDQPVVMIEVQTGQYLGEDDIVRFSDAYGRTLG
ncbi:MAG: hypothetical protein RL014_2725 [Pseudomonadota bacterium]